MVERVHQLSNIPVPKSLADLKNKERRFTKVIRKDEMKDFVAESLSL